MHKNKIFKKKYSEEVFNDYNEDLNSFSININSNYETKTKNKNQGIWIKVGEEIKVGEVKITGGFFYFGGQLKSVDNYETEASLVDNTLEIKRNNSSYFEDLGYWPKYNQLSPINRGIYIQWLATKRDDINIPLGYVFLYFYGIERRVLIDYKKGLVSDEESKSLYNEIIRLRNVYGENKSLYRYTTQLLDYICILNKNILPNKNALLAEPHHSLLFRYTLANIVNDSQPIPAEIALLWLYECQEYSFRTPSRRCKKEFESLFIDLYKKEFGEGLVLKANKTKFKIDFHPANNTIYGFEDIEVNLPEVSILKTPIKKLKAIADTCTEQLDNYSRYLGKKGTSTDDLMGQLLLPDVIFNMYKKPIINDFYFWLEKEIPLKNGLISVNEIWNNLKLPVPEKINKKEIDFIINLMNKLGLGIAPDPRYHHTKPIINGKIVIFNEGHGEYFKPSITFNEIGMKLRLGSMVATADGSVEKTEKLLLEELISHNIKLSPTEKQSLQAYLIWRLHTSSNSIGLKSRIEILNIEEKSRISNFLISIALADGKIVSEEIKQLEKLYVSLGLDKSMVTTDIHQISSSWKLREIESEFKNRNESINNTVTENKNVNLNKKMLEIIESETQDVQKMLGEIFIEEDSTSKDDEVKMNQVDVKFSNFGLDTKHNKLYSQLLTQEEWSKTEVQKICEEIGLMMEAAFESINDWSFELVDAPVINDEDIIYIDNEIVKEIKEIEGQVC